LLSIFHSVVIYCASVSFNLPLLQFGERQCATQFRMLGRKVLVNRFTADATTTAQPYECRTKQWNRQHRFRATQQSTITNGVVAVCRYACCSIAAYSMCNGDDETVVVDIIVDIDLVDCTA
jgi:hypothetical protein